MSDQGDAGRAAPGGRQRVAVLGGGAGGIAAAFALTATQALRDRFEVTVYLPGWRLGGKGASGRDRDFGRIEEHGLHIWFGFYENSFRMLDACLAELAERKDEHVPGRRPARKVSWKTSADAFVDCEQLVLNEPVEGGGGAPIARRCPRRVRTSPSGSAAGASGSSSNGRGMRSAGSPAVFPARRSPPTRSTLSSPGRPRSLPRSTVSRGAR